MSYDYNSSLVNFINAPFQDSSDYNVIAIMTEWDEFKTYNWKPL